MRSILTLFVFSLLCLSGPAHAGDVVSGEPNIADPDLRLWFDASDTNTVWQDADGTIPATNGTIVARWDDKSLSGIIATQTNTNNVPGYTNNLPAFNGLPAVRFAGDGSAASDALSSTTGNSTGITGTTNLTLVTIWQNTGFTGVNYQHTFHMGNNATSQAYGHSTSRGGGVNSAIGNHYWNGGFDTYDRASTDVTMALSSFDGSNDTWYVNGRFAGTGVRVLNISANQLHLGSRVAPIIEGFDGYLAEVILYNRVLTTAERNALGEYVASKYGIPIEEHIDPPAEPRINPRTGMPNANHPDLELWLDASDTNTVWQDVEGLTPVTNGSVVARWDDKSINQLIMTQPSPVNQPVYANAINNFTDRAAIQFVGGVPSDALTSTTGNTTAIRNNSPLTLITVWQNTAFTDQSYQHTFHMGTTLTHQAYGHSTSGREADGNLIGNHYWADSYSTTNVTGELNRPTMTLSSYDGINDQWYVNGVDSGFRAIGLGIGRNEIQIGSRLQPYVEGFTGDLAEVMLFTEILTEAERHAVGYYIMEKYGFSITNASVVAGFGVHAIAYVPGLDPDNADVVVTWESNSSATYTLEVATQPDGPWTPLAVGIPGEDGMTTYVHPVMGASALVRRYFRIGEE